MAAIKRTFPQSLIENICSKNSNEYTRILFDLIAEQRLTPREIMVIKNRYGYYGDKVDTLEEVAKLDGTTKERIRQIEAKALRKLNLSYITKFIKNLIEENKVLKLEREQIIKNQFNTPVSVNNIYNVDKISICYTVLALASKFNVYDLFQTRPANCLIRGGIKDLGKLLLTGNDTICKLRNLGKKSEYEIFTYISNLFTDDGYTEFLLEIQEKRLFDNVSILRTISAKEFFDFIELLKQLPDIDYIYDSIIKQVPDELNFKELQELLKENYSKDIDLNSKYKQLQDDYKELKSTLVEHKKQIEEKYNEKLEKEKIKLEDKVLKDKYMEELELEKNKLKQEYIINLQNEIDRVRRNYENQKTFSTKDEIRKTLKIDVEKELASYKEMCKRNIDVELETYRQEQLNQIKNKTDKEIDMYIIGRLSAKVLNNTDKTGIKIDKVYNNISITYTGGGNNE